MQVPVAYVQLPPFDLLKEPDGGDVLVVPGGTIPAVQGVPVNPQSRPAKMLAQEEFRLNRCRAQAGSEVEVLVIGAGQHSAGAESQRGQPGRIRLERFIEDLVADAERPIHQPGRGFGCVADREGTRPFGGGPDVQIDRPLLGEAILQGEIALVDVDAVTLSVSGFNSDVILFALGPDVVGFGFLIHQPEHELAAFGQVGPLRERPVRDVLRGRRHGGQCRGQRQAGQETEFAD